MRDEGLPSLPDAQGDAGNEVKVLVGATQFTEVRARDSRGVKGEDGGGEALQG